MTLHKPAPTTGPTASLLNIIAQKTDHVRTRPRSSPPAPPRSHAPPPPPPPLQISALE
ncbi:hypothetical protein HETIRDRAFT_411050, partial [Heterobasidion irregulare TC 32-1]